MLMDLVRAVDSVSSAGRIARRYRRRRIIDVVLVNLATDLLVRLFSNRLFRFVARALVVCSDAGPFWPLSAV